MNQQPQQQQQQQQPPQIQNKEELDESNEQTNDDNQSNEGFVVKMRGLPWSATADDIIKFLSILGIFGTLTVYNSKKIPILLLFN